MKRNDEGKILIKMLGNYEVLVHNISEIDTDYEVVLNSIYEHIEVYTDKGQSIPAFRYCPSEDMECYDRRLQSRAVLLATDPHFREYYDRSKAEHNPVQNCLGFCVLDGEYWINLNRENLDYILADDSYTEVAENYREDHLVIYYINDSPVHISRFNAALMQYEHKPGLHNPQSQDSTDIDEHYQYSGMRYFRKN